MNVFVPIKKLIVSNCNTHAEQNISLTKEAKWYKIDFRPKGWVQKSFELYHWILVSMKVAIIFFHFASHGWKWEKCSKYAIKCLSQLSQI